MKILGAIAIFLGAVAFAAWAAIHHPVAFVLGWLVTATVVVADLCASATTKRNL